MYGSSAPKLTPEGFRTGCSQPGPAKPQKQDVTIGDLKFTVTRDDILITSADAVAIRQLQVAAEMVGNTSLRISRIR